MYLFKDTGLGLKAAPLVAPQIQFSAPVSIPRHTWGGSRGFSCHSNGNSSLLIKQLTNDKQLLIREAKMGCPEEE